MAPNEPNPLVTKTGATGLDTRRVAPSAYIPLVPKILRVLDVFSGCGGFSAGLALGGSDIFSFETVAAVDMWSPACKSFGTNFPDAVVLNETVEKGSIAKALNTVGDIDIIIGGPPCQGFSMSGKRALRDPRNRLVLEFLNAVEMARPSAFVMENVPGFHTFQGGNLFKDVWREATALGYELWAGILLASRYGVPQRRRRFFLAGVKGSTAAFPHDAELFCDLSGPRLSVVETSDFDTQVVTFNDATSDLPSLVAGSGSASYASRPANGFQRWARRGQRTLTEHVAPNHRSSIIKLIQHLGEGESAITPSVRRSIPNSLRPTSGFGNSYRRIRSDQPAPTITRNFTTPSSANCIHPSQNRSLTLREGARCQSFRDSFKFEGTFTDKRLLIGNAVPPLLARQLGDWLIASLAA